MNTFNRANKPEEVLDHVDQNDTVIGTIVRHIANQDPQYTHREIGIIIVNDDEDILIQKRSKHKKIHPGMWSITAGHILAGEDPEQTAHTELAEELGFDTQLVFLEKCFHRYDHETHFMYYYLAQYKDEPITIESAEVETYQFVSYTDLQKMLESNEEQFNPIHMPTIQKYFSGHFKKQQQELD